MMSGRSSLRRRLREFGVSPHSRAHFCFSDRLGKSQIYTNDFFQVVINRFFYHTTLNTSTCLWFLYFEVEKYLDLKFIYNQVSTRSFRLYKQKLPFSKRKIKELQNQGRHLTFFLIHLLKENQFNYTLHLELGTI